MVNKEQQHRRPGRFPGSVVRLAGMIGVLACLLGMIVFPILLHRYQPAVQNFLDETAAIMLTGSTGVRDAADTMADTSEVMKTIIEALNGASDSLREVEELSEAAYLLLSDQIPLTLIETQDALGTVEAASGEIDSVLRALDLVGFITGVEYDPEKPLDEAVAGVAHSLDPIAESLQDVSQALYDSTDELSNTSDTLSILAVQLTPYGEDLLTLQEELTDLADRMQKAGRALKKVSGRLPVILWGAAAALELILLWSCISQYAIYVVGDRLIGEREIDPDN